MNLKLKYPMILFMTHPSDTLEYKTICSTRPISEKDAPFLERLAVYSANLKQLESKYLEIRNNRDQSYIKMLIKKSIDEIRVKIEEEKLFIVVNNPLENVFWYYKVIDLECSILFKQLKCIDNIVNCYQELQDLFDKKCQQKYNLIRQILETDETIIRKQISEMNLYQYDCYYEDYTKLYQSWKNLVINPSNIQSHLQSEISKKIR